MKLSEYIELLQRKLAELPQNPEVAFTQDGYYAGGTFADLHQDPVIEEIPVWEGSVEKTTCLVLGHSYQSY